jgi:AcrR family transcriptional regulator
MSLSCPTDSQAVHHSSSSPKRRQILDGARQASDANGYAGASMDQIAALAGVSKGTLYVYFNSKETLFEAVITEEAQQFAEKLPSVESDLAIPGQFSARAG